MVEKHCWSRKIWVQQIWATKKIWSKLFSQKNLKSKKFWLKKSGSKKYKVQKFGYNNLDPNEIGSIFLGLNSCVEVFSCAATQYVLCVSVVCVSIVCPRFLIWNDSLFEYLEYSRILKKRERFHIKSWKHTDNKQTH